MKYTTHRECLQRFDTPKPHKSVRFVATVLLVASTGILLGQTNPVVVGASHEYWGSANHLDYSDNYVFLSIGRDAEYLHWVYDVSSRTNPIPVGPTGQYGEFITTAGGYGYIVNPPGINVYDLSAPTNAHAVGLLTNAGRMVISGSFAYVACGSSGLCIYDVSNPTNPVALGHSTNNYGGIAADVAVSDNYAYVANGTDGVRVYDVSNPNAPFSVGPSGISAGAQLITISGNYAYVGVGQTNFPDWGTTIYDITSRTNPVRGGHVTWLCGEMSLSGNYLYLADGSIWIFDVSDFNNPINAGYYSDGGEWYTDIKVKGAYAYVSGVSIPFYVFWLGTQSPPQIGTRRDSNTTVLLSWPTPSAAFSVQQSSDLDSDGWVTLTNSPTVVGSQNQVSVPTSTHMAFYRLISTP